MLFDSETPVLPADTLPVCNTKQHGLKKGRLNGWVSDGLGISAG